MVRLELADAEARLVQVDLARTQFDALQPSLGERLYVTPQKVRVFLQDGHEFGGSGI